MASPPADYSMGPPASGDSTPTARGRGRGRGARGGADGEGRGRGRGGGKGSRGGGAAAAAAAAAGQAPRGGAGARGGRGSRGIAAGASGSRGGGSGARGGRGSRGARGSSAKRSTSASTGPGRDRSTSTQVAHRAGSDDEDLAGPSGAGVVNAEDEADDGEDEYEDAEVEESWEDASWARQKALNDAKKANLSALIDAMTPEQYDRHEVYLRQSVNKHAVRRIMSNATGGQTIPLELASLAGGMAKVFVGELVEKARALRAERDPEDTGPLHPLYYQEAYRIYKEERERPGQYPQGGGVPGLGKRRRLF